MPVWLYLSKVSLFGSGVPMTHMGVEAATWWREAGPLVHVVGGGWPAGTGAACWYVWGPGVAGWYGWGGGAARWCGLMLFFLF